MESTKSKALVDEFLAQARKLTSDVEPVRVLRARTYKIGNANVLVRAAIQTAEGRPYFFGLNYITAEEVANLDNPFFAFVCGSVDQTIILPGHVLRAQLPFVSHDRNGEYKINIDRNLNLVLSGKQQRFFCSEFRNAWKLLVDPSSVRAIKNTIEQSFHSVIQGRLLEIGRLRGFDTYTPNKAKLFNGVQLGRIASLKECPKLEFSEYNVLRQIDVLWFRNRERYLVPEFAFEVELSTGTWSGVGRMATLLDYNNARLYVISNDLKKYRQVVDVLDLTSRYRHVSTDDLGELYSAELNLRELRTKIDL